MGLTVAIVSTGHEVLRGHTVNTNASWLARAATDAGARVTSVRTVGDDVPDIARAIGDASREAQCVLATGGLGPTEDDRTREALASVMGEPLLDDAGAWAGIEAHFARMRKPPGPTQRRQALLPRGARSLDNDHGTAPGIEAVVPGGACLFLLPGPPREMQAMFQRQVLPRWRAAGDLDETASRVVWTAGAPESEIAAAIDDLMRDAEPIVGTHPDEGEVAVRLLARGPGAAVRADTTLAEIERRLGSHVVSSDEGVRVQHAVVRRLGALRLVVTTAESVTGGLVARMLCEVPGASGVFRGGVVAYSDAWKRDALGVPADLIAREGAVSEAVVRAMAERARSRSSADCAIATTGLASPSADGPVESDGSVHVAVAFPNGTRHVALRFALVRLAVQRRTAVAALDLLRRALLSTPLLSTEDGDGDGVPVAS